MILFNQYKLSNYIKVTSFFFLLGVLISYNLWTNNRNFPVFPLIDHITIPNYLVSIVKYGFIGLLVTLTYVTKRCAIITLFVFLSMLVFSDQMRLQPWVYFYFLMLLPFAITKRNEQIINYLRFVFIIMYLWSGIHKLNPNFQNLIFESILIDGFGVTSPTVLFSLKPLAFIVPITEILIAISLLFYRTRKIGIYLVLFTHLFVLYYLIFGLKGNWVILPWNLFIMLSVIYLFSVREEKLSILFKNKVLTSLLVVVFLIPFGFYSGHIDQRLSFSLYDGRLKSLYELNSGSDSPHKVLTNNINKGSIIDYNLWAFKELEVPFYPEKRFLKKLTDRKHKFILTDLPLWERNLKGTFKTEEELKSYSKVFSFGNVTFNTVVYFPKYQVLQ